MHLPWLPIQQPFSSVVQQSERLWDTGDCTGVLVPEGHRDGAVVPFERVWVSLVLVDCACGAVTLYLPCQRSTSRLREGLPARLGLPCAPPPPPLPGAVGPIPSRVGVIIHGVSAVNHFRNHEVHKVCGSTPQHSSSVTLISR